MWSGRKTIAEDLTGEDLGDVLELHADASAWWVLPREDPQSLTLREVAQALDLDDLALKDLLATDGRAKYEEVGQARLVITNAVSVDQERSRITVHPLSIIATDRALICLFDPCPDFQPARLLSGHGEVLARGGVDSGLHLLIHAVISTYEVAVDWLEEGSDALSDLLFDEHPLDKPQQLQAFRLRKALSELRRATEPMRTVLGDLVQAQPPAPKSRAHRERATDRHWVALNEHHDRVADAVDGLRETLSSVFDTSLALERPPAQPDHEEADRLGRHHRRAHPGHQLRRDERGLSAGGHGRGFLALPGDHGRLRTGPVRGVPGSGLGLRTDAP